MTATASGGSCHCHPSFHELGTHERDGVLPGPAPRRSGPTWLQLLAELVISSTARRSRPPAGAGRPSADPSGLGELA